MDTKVKVGVGGKAHNFMGQGWHLLHSEETHQTTGVVFRLMALPLQDFILAQSSSPPNPQNQLSTSTLKIISTVQ